MVTPPLTAARDSFSQVSSRCLDHDVPAPLEIAEDLRRVEQGMHNIALRKYDVGSLEQRVLEDLIGEHRLCDRCGGSVEVVFHDVDEERAVMRVLREDFGSSVMTGNERGLDIPIRRELVEVDEIEFGKARIDDRSRTTELVSVVA